MYSKIIKGYKISQEEALDLCENMSLDALRGLANDLRKYFLGNKIDTCSILNAKSGKCSENCKWCAQSAFHSTGCEVYPLMSKEKSLAFAKKSKEQGISKFSLVTSGKRLSKLDLEAIAESFKEMSKIEGLGLCGSFGLLSKEDFQVLKDAGMKRFHCNLESAPSYFDKLCTTHSTQDKIDSILAAKDVGLEICSGGIIGMGETLSHRIELAITLRDLGVDSIPLNILQPIKNTPLENQVSLSKEEILTTFAIFRIINPSIHIRFAGGRMSIKDVQEKALRGGMSGILMGDMLTTVGSDVANDFSLLDSLNYEY